MTDPVVRGDSPEGRSWTLHGAEDMSQPWFEGPDLKFGETITVYESPASEGQELREALERYYQSSMVAEIAYRRIIEGESEGQERELLRRLLEEDDRRDWDAFNATLDELRVCLTPSTQKGKKNQPEGETD